MLGAAILVLSTSYALEFVSISLRPSDEEDEEKEQADPDNPQHIRLIQSMQKAYDAVYPGESARRITWTTKGHYADELAPARHPTVYVSKEKDWNAWSQIHGVLGFTEESATLPDWALDATAAHEVAHDLLLHARRAAEFADVVETVANIISFVARAGPEGRERTAALLRDLVEPWFSRRLELEADTRAVHILKLMGYEDPAQVLYDMFKLDLDHDADTGGGFFDDHPATTERLARFRLLR